MQIVIDIPDRIYKIVQNRTLNITDDEILENALKNGIPLPKGHGRLIDADALLEKHRIDLSAVAPTIIEADKEQDNGNDD